VLTLDLDALGRLVTRATGAPPDAITPMVGGASTRRYLRVRAGAASLVAMFVPDADPSARWPFLEVHELLHGSGVRVPALIDASLDEGLLLLEDLGDETLDAFIARAPERRAEIYREAVRDLAKAQRALAELPRGSVVTTRAFDEALLGREFDHFREWGLDARGCALAPANRVLWDAITARLARRIAALPRGFVHRDYQSRNLMVREEGAARSLVWLDFQDALLGPRAYDLVALLYDSYQSLERAFIEARLDDFAEAQGDDAAGRAALGREFDLIAVQRKLKDAGRFVFIERVRGNPAFLPYVEPTLAMVREALANLADEADMLDLARIVGLAS
jgi:N-acetylmuramate 1-kinase